LYPSHFLPAISPDFAEQHPTSQKDPVLIISPPFRIPVACLLYPESSHLVQEFFPCALLRNDPWVFSHCFVKPGVFIYKTIDGFPLQFYLQLTSFLSLLFQFERRSFLSPPFLSFSLTLADPICLSLKNSPGKAFLLSFLTEGSLRLLVQVFSPRRSFQVPSLLTIDALFCSSTTKVLLPLLLFRLSKEMPPVKMVSFFL